MLLDLSYLPPATPSLTTGMYVFLATCTVADELFQSLLQRLWSGAELSVSLWSPFYTTSLTSSLVAALLIIPKAGRSSYLMHS
jgi:hypothetical protein